jgi:hypothetical protein
MYQWRMLKRCDLVLYTLVREEFVEGGTKKPMTLSWAALFMD